MRARRCLHRPSWRDARSSPHSVVRALRGLCWAQPFQTDAIIDGAIVRTLLSRHQSSAKISQVTPRPDLSSCASPVQSTALGTVAIALISVCAVLGCAVLVLATEWVYRCRTERAAYARMGIHVSSTADEDRAMLESEAWGNSKWCFASVCVHVQAQAHVCLKSSSALR